MPRILITGNSGSGKSTLARALSARFDCPHVDLDTVAWEEGGAGEDGDAPPTRRALADSAARIDGLLDGHDDWIVEGCYADLLELVRPRATEFVFLDPGVEACRANCRRRPFEPHKYASPQEQDRNLPMLLEWVGRYAERTDAFSAAAHRRLFDGFDGPKHRFTSEVGAEERARIGGGAG
jgi:adenylate kinase family enzyme